MKSHDVLKDWKMDLKERRLKDNLGVSESMINSGSCNMGELPS